MTTGVGLRPNAKALESPPNPTVRAPVLYPTGDRPRETPLEPYSRRTQCREGEASVCGAYDKRRIAPVRRRSGGPPGSHGRGHRQIIRRGKLATLARRPAFFRHRLLTGDRVYVSTIRLRGRIDARIATKMGTLSAASQDSNLVRKDIYQKIARRDQFSVFSFQCSVFSRSRPIRAAFQSGVRPCPKTMHWQGAG